MFRGSPYARDWFCLASLRRWAVIGVWVWGGAVLFADLPDAVQPVLRTYCLECHSTEKHKGDLDLERSEIAKEPHVWENVLEQIALGEMPPKKAKALPEREGRILTAWVRESLDRIAQSSAGDPGPVILRRLSNMEYTYTVRDLTGVETLDPAREFPVDGAAGEGFTNAGAALVMSPALLTKYLDAAKEIAAHAVLLPDGIRFSPSVSREDWKEETLAKIRGVYARHTVAMDRSVAVTGAGSIRSQGGGVDLKRYLEAAQGKGSDAGLNVRYLARLREVLAGGESSAVLDPLREKFRARVLRAEDVQAWQEVLWRFASVGHIGKLNGPKAWQEPVNPLKSSHEIRVRLEGEGEQTEQTLYLTTRSAGGSGELGEGVWEGARLVGKGRLDLPVEALPELVAHLEKRRALLLEHTEACLNAIAAGRSDADPGSLSAWKEYLGFGAVELKPFLLGKKSEAIGGYSFVKGWLGEKALGVMANSSDNPVRIPGLLKPHSVAVHPSPQESVAVAWRCEKEGVFHMDAEVTPAHSECGNGVTWSLEVWRGGVRDVLSHGLAQGPKTRTIGPIQGVSVRAGQSVVLVIGPREGNHSCDLTSIDLHVGDETQSWSLAREVSSNLIESNPKGPWHFLKEPTSASVETKFPDAIAAWRKTPSEAGAREVRRHLERDFPLSSPLLAQAVREFRPVERRQSWSAQAGTVREVKLPAGLGQGLEFVVMAKAIGGGKGGVQMEVLREPPKSLDGLVPGAMEAILKKGQWSENNHGSRFSSPVLAVEGGEAWKRFEREFDAFREVFPIMMCYSQIVPADEVVTLTLFHREDEPLRRLMLSAEESHKLDRLWDELLFVSEAPLKQMDVFEQLWQFATQDASPKAFEPMRDPIFRAAEAFREKVRVADGRQRAAVGEFASKAWRRPLSAEERREIESIPPRLGLVRVMTSPAFLYRGESIPDKTAPVGSWELATRLSYFLWGSAPDEELRNRAASGRLLESVELSRQAKRMLKDERVRRLALECVCQWLHVRDLAGLEEKSERHFPTFRGVRGDLQEEVVRFVEDLLRNDGSAVAMLNADHTFLNATLAQHYGIELKGADWRRVDGMRGHGRGGVLGFGAILAKQAGASRNSAILRGTWVSEVLLGEKLPKPPKGVPVLPDEAPKDLSERQLIERHSQDPNCMSCHRRIDPFGFALEGFDAIGRARAADTRTSLPDGTAVEGMAELREYLVRQRREDFLRQFCRKLLGYALGRSVQLSDRPLLEELVRKSERSIGEVVEAIVLSRQFREIRGAEFTQASRE